jgi:hypothetical protein
MCQRMSIEFIVFIIAVLTSSRRSTDRDFTAIHAPKVSIIALCVSLSPKAYQYTTVINGLLLDLSSRNIDANSTRSSGFSGSCCSVVT